MHGFIYVKEIINLKESIGMGINDRKSQTSVSSTIHDCFGEIVTKATDNMIAVN